MYTGNKKKKGYVKNKNKTKVNKSQRDQFLKKVLYCTKHYDLTNDKHDTEEKKNRQGYLTDLSEMLSD